MTDTSERAAQNGQTKTLSIDDILAAAPKPETNTLHVPDWGGSVTVRGLTHAEMHHAKRIASRNYASPIDDAVLWRELFISGFVSPDGKRISEEQYRLLSYRKGTGIQLVVAEILRLSGVGEDAAREAAAAFPASGDGA